MCGLSVKDLCFTQIPLSTAPNPLAQPPDKNEDAWRTYLLDGGRAPSVAIVAHWDQSLLRFLLRRMGLLWQADSSVINATVCVWEVVGGGSFF